MKEIGLIGLWHQGIVAAACLARCGLRVRAADADAERVDALRRGKAPIFEPGLDDLLAEGLKAGRLAFATDPATAVRGLQDVLLMMDTPVDEHDQSDLSGIWHVLDEIVPHLEAHTVLYVTAQVPVGTCGEMLRRIKAKRPELQAGVAYSPENLRLGQAIERFMKPPLPVIGTDEDWVFERVVELLRPLQVDAWTRTGLKAAEMTKHALNAFLATCVTFGNELGNLCDEVGADGVEVVKALRLEERVGRKAMLMPGLGFSGGTLARDVQTLREIGKRQQLETTFLDGLWAANQKQNGIVKRKLGKLFKSLQGVKILVLGLTYKPDTSTLRRSAALEIIAELAAAGAVVTGHDPMADPAELAQHRELRAVADVYEAAQGQQALVLMTPWKHYKELDMPRLFAAMQAHPVVLDTANLWEAARLEQIGFRYFNIGRGRKT